MKRHATRASLSLFGALMMYVGALQTGPVPCRLIGEWVRDDQAQRIEFYESSAHWFGRVVWSSDKGVIPGFVMLRDFLVDQKTGQLKGIVVMPSSGMQAAGNVTCVGDDQIRVTGHKLFLSKSHTFVRATR